MCSCEDIPPWLIDSSPKLRQKTKPRLNFLRKMIQHFAQIFNNELYLSVEAGKNGFLQQIDPRAKLIVFLGFIVFSNLARNFMLLGFLLLINLLYAKLSKLSILRLFRRSWLIIPPFLLICSIPALFSSTIPGKELVVLLLPIPRGFIFSSGLAISDNGLRLVSLLCLRSGVAISFAYLLIVTTRWHDLTQGLSLLKVPASAILILDMTSRYIFLLVNLVLQISEARFLRSVGKLSHSENRRFLGHSLALLFIKANFLATEISAAMRLRGFNQRLVSLRTLNFGLIDWMFLLNNLVIGLILFILLRGL